MLVGAFTASAQSIESEFTRELKTKNSGITSIHAEMTQIREVAVLADAVTKEGVFYYLEPANLLLAFEDGDYIKLTAEWFEMRSGSSVTRRSTSANPMLKQLSAILSACMSGNLEGIAKGFTPTITKSDKQWRVVLQPERSKGGAKIAQIELLFNRTDMSLDSLKMVEKSGDCTIYTFRNKQFNVVINDQLFTI